MINKSGVRNILNAPTTIDNKHESTMYRSYWIVAFIEDMLDNGASAETAIAAFRILRALPDKDDNKIKITLPHDGGMAYIEKG